MNRFEEFQMRRNTQRVRLRVPPFDSVKPEMSIGYKLGNGLNKLKVAIKNLTRNILMIGEPGSGKTTAIAAFILGIWATIKIIAIDSVKHDYRHLHNYSDKFLTLSYPLKTFRDNYLEPPPGLTDEEWDQILIETYGQPFHVPIGAGSDQYGYTCIRELKTKVHPHKPSFRDLLEYMKSKNEPRYSENSKYRERNLIRLKSVVENLGENISVSEGYPLDYLIDGDFNLALELPSKQDMASFAADVFIYKILLYRMKLQVERRRKIVLLISDEAKKIFGIHRDIGVRGVGNISNLAQLVSSAREFNLGFLFSDQSISSLHPIIFELCDTFILFKANAESTLRMGRVMGLSQEQMAWLSSGGLEVGQCVIKTGIFPPVLVNIPHFEYQKTVTDEEIRF